MRTLICKNCNQERELMYFRITRTNGKIYYNKAKCKVCISKNGNCTIIEKRMKSKILREQTPITNVNISNECKTFLEDLKRARGYVDVLMAYKLIHYHIETFGNKVFLTDSPEEQLAIMYTDFTKLDIMNERS